MERDQWLLEALAKMLFLTTRQIALLLFGGSRSAANKRLRKLFDRGYLRVWLRNLAEDNVYSITRRGLAVLGETGVGHAAPRGLDGRLDHLLAINSVRIAFATTLPESAVALTWWRSDWEIRAQARRPLVPDALFHLSWGDVFEWTFRLEVDRHTKNSRRFITKMLRYEGMSSDLNGLVDAPVLIVAHDARWLERYRSTLKNLPMQTPVWFALLADVVVDPFAAIWQSPMSPEKHSLRNLPYRKDMPTEKSAVLPGQYNSTDARLSPIESATRFRDLPASLEVES